jgi:hypothetical protein
VTDLEAFLDHAASLGLTVSGSSAAGLVDGRRVELGITLSSNAGASYAVRTHLDPPLDLGLDMRERRLGRFGEAPVVTGHPDLDAEFSVSADEPERVRALFTSDLRGEVAALYRGSLDLRVHDGGCAVYATEGFYVVDDAWLDRAVRGSGRVVALMDEARPQVPPAEPLLGHAAALRALAAARGLRLSTAPLLAEGVVEGLPITLGAARTGRRKHHLHAEIGLSTDLGLNLAVRRQGLLDEVRTLLGGQDIHVGDAPFDQRFLVRADPERAERVALLLDREVRAALLGADARAGEVHLGDRSLRVDPIPADRAPETLSWLLDTLVEAASRIAQNHVRGGAEAGPYR